MIPIATVFIVLGNGFTIDLIKTLKLDDYIDVKNLFRFGHEVPWPANDEAGFLSFKRCQNLWNLGARPFMSDEDSISLIEDIITCANVSASTDNNSDNIYIKAYKELAIYLKHLFIYYNNKVTNKILFDIIPKWGWSRYLDQLNLDNTVERVVIVTYNYDIWLERILNLAGIRYWIGGIQSPDSLAKFIIFKPHGSISFTHKISLDKSSFKISYKKSLRDLLEGEPIDFRISHNNLDHNYLINPIIPPAGDSERLRFGWANKLRNLANTEAQKLSNKDEVIICGLSYSYVDRKEIDDFLTSIPSDVNLKLVNPNPHRALNAVISSIFENYTLHVKSDLLGE